MAFVSFKINDSDLYAALDIKLDEITDQIFADSQDNIVTKNIIDEGTLLKSGKITSNFLNKEIKYDVPYAEEIEFGRTPGTEPPFGPILAWVKRKKLAKNDSAAYAFAKNIVRKIKEQGKEPRPFLSPAVDKAKAQFK